MKKNWLLFFLILASLSLFWCSLSTVQTDYPTPQEETLITHEDNSSYQSKISADKIQLYHFHGTNQCRSCVTLGELTQKTLDEFFVDELKSGKITYEHINVELPENSTIAQKFQVRNISLYINSVVGDRESYEDQVTLMRYLNNEEQFKNYLKDKIDTLLGK